MEVLIEGRLLYVQVKNTLNIIQNIFCFYGNHGTVASREAHIDISQKYISDNNLDEIFYLGDFNYVISNLDTNSNPKFPTIAKKWLAFE